VSDRAVVVFVKHPRPGEVKTRLVPALGAEGAAGLYRVLVEAALAATTPAAGEFERLVFFDPPAAADAMRAWLPGVRLRRQGGGDLGARMADAFERVFARGASRVAIVGSDVPGVDRRRVVEALEALDAADVVLGPAADGGYYLIALSRPRPELMEGVPWSTPAVLDATLARASTLGLKVHRQPVLRDLDTIEDLRAEWPRLRARFEASSDLRRAIELALGDPGRR
jgi:rSAM/selenodomain-associated transferase 1